MVRKLAMGASTDLSSFGPFVSFVVKERFS
jgi:hypothetical protein